MARVLSSLGFLFLWFLGAAFTVQAQSTPFTYQGRVTSNGAPFTGTGQFKFALITAANVSRQATATATISGTFLTIVSVNDGGAGYVSIPSVTALGGGGSGAVLTANIAGGAVTSITVNNPGNGYTSTPTIVIGPPADSFAYTTYWSNNGTSVSGAEPSAAVSVPVANGIFTVELGNTSLANMQSIAASVFSQSNLLLRIWFNDGVSGFAALHPPQRLTYAPYAANAVAAATLTGTLTSANLPTGSITSDKLAAGAAAANLQSNGQSGVASGGIVLSASANPSLISAGYIEIGSTQLLDRWQFHGTGAGPEGRAFNTAVWTGTEMIVWGGMNENGPLNTGGRFNPVTGVWTAVSTTGAPSARYYHTAIWTGSEMVVWGGFDGMTHIDSGGRYNPATNTWTSVTTTGAPTARQEHTAVWTGTEMIVWGGGGNNLLDTGGRYTPSTGTWAAGGISTTDAPGARYSHTAVWTGSEMIIWGGSAGNSGGRYNPATNTWAAGGTTTMGAPLGRSEHTAVWTGTEMIIWGGALAIAAHFFNDGGRYNPQSNSWTSGGIAAVGAPGGRSRHTAIWNGSEMIVWGGVNGNGPLNDGARYRPTSNTWSLVTLNGAPTARQLHSAVWTGQAMIIWGGFTFSTFNDTWTYDPGKVMLLYQKP